MRRTFVAAGRRSAVRGRTLRTALSLLMLGMLLAGAAAISTGNNIFGKPASAPQSAPTLTLDYRGSDPGVYQYRDVAIGDVSLASPGLEIVRAGNRSSPTWGNISVSKFNESGGFQNLTGIEHFWQEYFRVDTGQMRPGGPEEIVAAGRWSGDGGTSYQAAVRIINGTAPASQIAWKSYGAPVDSYFWAVAVGDVDLDGEVEFVGVGDAIVGAGGERGLVVVGNLTGGAMQDEHYALYNGSFLPGTVLRYWSVAIANVDGQGDPEIVIAGDLRGAAFLQIGNFTAGKWTQIRNITYRTYASSTVYMVDVADIDGDAQMEIVCVGKERDPGNSTSYARVSTFTWDGPASPIVPGATRMWTGNNDDAAAYDVVLEDLSSDPGREISTIGYNKNGSQPGEFWGELNVMNGSLAELTKMQWNGSDIDHWGMSAGDVDADGKLELVSVGMKGVSGIWEGETQVTEVPDSLTPVAAAAVAVLFLGSKAAFRRSALHQRRRERRH